MQSEKRTRPYAEERPAVFRFEKWLQTHAGKHPAAFYGLYRLARKDRARVVTPETELVIEGFPRSANTFARVAFNRAQKGKVRIATGLQALRYYLSFYETVEDYSDAYVLGTFEEVTGDFGRVILRLNDRFGTSFSPFRHNERNVEAVLARVQRNSKRKFGEAHWENKASLPVVAREETKRELERELKRPEVERTLLRSEAVYDRLTATG
jgi:hypothetical protein